MFVCLNRSINFTSLISHKLIYSRKKLILKIKYFVTATAYLREISKLPQLIINIQYILYVLLTGVAEDPKFLQLF